MKKLERLATARTPDGTVLTLFRHDGAYSIRVDGVELMSTRRHHSEERLAELVCSPLRERPRARVLIGGLGFGFTLQAALRSLAPDAQVVVAEIAPAVIGWNRNPDYQLAGGALSDARVDLRQDDVANVLRESPRMFDGIMLDVDNGADALTSADNAKLYDRSGVQMTVAALRVDGLLAYWSARPDPMFKQSLREAGLDVRGVRVRAHASSGTRHTIFVARSASRQAPALD